MSDPKHPLYIAEEGPQPRATAAPATSSSGDGISCTPQSQNAVDTSGSEKVQPQSAELDIEHMPVDDDPRLWSKTRKSTIVAIIAFATLAPTLSTNLYNPAIAQIKRELHATDGKIALSLSLFVLVLGNAPIIWSAISEIKGRKMVYIVSVALFCVGSAVCGAAKDINVLIGMRIVQAAGASSVINLGAGTLSDMYDSHERGTIMGIYFAGPLLGPSLGPIIGGALAAGFSWRATFWFLVIFAGITLCTFIFLPDTWRRERSTSYQTAKQKVLKERAKKGQEEVSARNGPPSPVQTRAVTPTPESQTPCAGPIEEQAKRAEVGKEKGKDCRGKAKFAVIDVKSNVDSEGDVKLSMLDVNPILPIWHILKQRANLWVLFASALLFAFQYGICFTVALTFAGAPYNYDSIKIGLVLLSFGLGNLSGSILGGRWSDHILTTMKAQNGGVSIPEIRLESTKPALGVLPLFVLGYAWMAQKHTHVAGPVVMLFFSGFCAIWIYSSTLTYIVDENPGRASSAIAANSCFRGIAGLVIAQVSVPLQNAIGDGGLYTIWAGLLIVCEAIIMLLLWRGQRWRAKLEQSSPV